VIRRLIEAGIDVARLNFSHGDERTHRKLAALVRREANRCGRAVGILADLQGPKIRLGQFAGEVPIRTRMRVTLTTRPSEARPQDGVIPVAYRALTAESQAGDELLVDDGQVRLRIESIRGHHLICEVLDGERLRPRAGLALPHARAVHGALTVKDRRDLAVALSMRVDFLGLSFVRRPEDLLEAQRLIDRGPSVPLLIAKIETRAACLQLDDIIAAADGVMVARGDLGVELPPERVPIEQKRIIEAAGSAGKPVITATQMLESMRHAPRPTRAEASDVANAVLDGSWGVMLSAETAVGSYPVEAVETMDRIAREAEAQLLRQAPRRRRLRPAVTVSEGIAEAGSWIAIDVGASAVIALTRSGATARQAARTFPALPIIAYSSMPRTLTRMTLFRGVEPRAIRPTKSLEQAISLVNKDLRARRKARRGDLVVILSGLPHERAGTTNRITVHRIR
jgi:pyruvate kinase